MLNPDKLAHDLGNLRNAHCILILKALDDTNPRSVKEISDALELDAIKIGPHLKNLANAGFVEKRGMGRAANYVRNGGRIQQVINDFSLIIK